MLRIWKIVIQLQGILTITGAVTLLCFDGGDITSYKETSLENAGYLIESNCLNVSRQTFMYAHGFTEQFESNNSQLVLKTLLTFGNINVIFVNWAKEASSGPSVIEQASSYSISAVPNTMYVGKLVGETIVKLTGFGLNLELVQMVGHSLGAHLVGYVGKTVISYGKILKSIIGLDPAGPLYNFPYFWHLDKYSASYVLAIQTDFWGYGLGTPCGTVDLWVNLGYYLNGTNSQPGCENQNDIVGNLCSHIRSVKLYVNCLVHDNLCLASKAGDYNDWVAQNGTVTDILNIREFIDTTTSGNYYMSTSGQQPFGRGLDGLKP